METSSTNSSTDPLLLLKERIIKAETLLEKYASLTKKFNDLEKSYSQAVENEKKAKKDAIKYMEKYCKLAKKSSCLLVKIKTLEDSINIKTNELKECQEEYTKLESVLQMYKSERKGHQGLKRDKDFLLSTLWKVLKRLEEEPKDYKSKKIAETFFKRFDRELMDLKLEDFRNVKVKNVTKLTEKDEFDIVLSPGSKAVDSVESDLIDTGVAPESVRLSLEEFDRNCVTGGIKCQRSNDSKVEGGLQNNDIKTVKVNVVGERSNLNSQSQSVPEFSYDQIIPQDFEESINSNLPEKHTLDNYVYTYASENEGVNFCNNRKEKNNMTSVISVSFPMTGTNSDTVMPNVGLDRGEYYQRPLNFQGKCFLLESKSAVMEKEMVPGKFRKTYCGRKFRASNQNDVITRKQFFDNRKLSDISCSSNENSVGGMKYVDIDCFNVSSETISLDADVPVEDIESIPDHSKYCQRIYDLLTASGQISRQKERDFNNEDSSSLLFVMENELFNELGKLKIDTDKTLIGEPCKTVSIFDVEDSKNLTPSGCKSDKEITNICFEFSSESGSMIDLNQELTNEMCQAVGKKSVFEQDEVSRKIGTKTGEEKKLRNSPRSGTEESNINCDPNLFVGNSVKRKLHHSEFIQQQEISEEEVYRVLKTYTNVPLLSPLKEKEPSNRRKPYDLQSPIRYNDSCNLSDNAKNVSNLKNSEKSCEDTLRNKSVNKEEEALSCNSETGTEGKEKEKVLDKFTQTVEKSFPQGNETVQKRNELSERIPFLKTLIRKICKVVWKRNLNKIKNIIHLGRMWKSHSSCFDFMKILLGIIDQPRSYNKKINIGTLDSLLKRKKCKNGMVLKSVNQKVSSWQVEDVEMTNVISKNEPLYNYSNEEDCSFFPEIPIRHYFMDSFNSTIVKSEEIRRQKNKMSFNWVISDQETGFPAPKTRKMEIYGSTCECNFCWKCGTDSDMTLQHCHSCITVNRFGKNCGSCTKTHSTINHLECTPKSNLENMTEIDVVDKHSDVLNPKSDYLKELVEVKKTEPSEESEDIRIRTDYSAIVLRRSSRIRNRNAWLTTKKSNTSPSLTLEESRNSKKVDSFGILLPLANDNSAASDEISKTSNDILPLTEVPEGSKSSKLKEKFEELFGEPELSSQSDCSSPDSGKNLKTFRPTKVQKQIPFNLRTDPIAGTSDATAIGKRHNFCYSNIKSSCTVSKVDKWDTLYIGDDEDSEKRSTENGVHSNDTFSSEDVKTGDDSNILSSIMTAMTKQTELFKPQISLKGAQVNDTNDRLASKPSQTKDCNSATTIHRKMSKEYLMKGDHSAFLNLPYYWNIDDQLGNQNSKKNCNENSDGGEEAKLKALVQKRIRNFLKADINTVEEGEEKIKSCVAVLKKASEDIVANVIVSEIMANVGEELKEFERPAPPLTQTQHRIMVILTFLSSSGEEFHRISNKILKIIWLKIFPENFFWPDDSLEMTARFYTALCKKLNNFKGIWKFCFKAITSMRQRWCIPIFVVLQVWPDIIHNADEIQDNLLVNTFVNVILHTPKSEEMRRKRQEQKLLAIKHLLINFYNFNVNATIEGFAQTLLESLFNNTPGSVDALVLLSKCRNWSWTRKNIIAKLTETLESWLNGNTSDITASKVLDFLQQISSVFPDGNAAEASSAMDLISTLTRIVTTEKINEITEKKTIKILCSLCHYSNVNDVLVRLLGKYSSSEPLHADIKRALALKNKRRKEGYRKANTKIQPKLRNKTKPKKKGKKKKRSVLDKPNVQA